jgi:putative sigma-54 modulation protein
MQVNITARHLKLTTAISDYVQKKIEKANRYCDNLIWTQVILDVEKNRHIAEFVLHASGRTFTAREESADLYAAIDLASDTLDQQLRRYKERRRENRRESRRETRTTRRTTQDWGDATALLEAPASDHRVSSMRSLRLIDLTLPEAISAMEQSDSGHWIFLNRANRRVTVIYRKPDKTYGVVEAISQ